MQSSMQRCGLAACLVFAGGLFTGCFLQGAGSISRLRDSVDRLNESARWGRLDIAGDYVAPKYRLRFFKERSAWTKNIQVADSQVASFVVQDDQKKAKVILQINWYNLGHMSLQYTAVEQTWSRARNHFFLTSERVIDGNPGLLVQSKSS